MSHDCNSFRFHPPNMRTLSITKINKHVYNYMYVHKNVPVYNVTINNFNKNYNFGYKMTPARDNQKNAY
jgi:hypothetical protein